MVNGGLARGTQSWTSNDLFSRMAELARSQSSLSPLVNQREIPKQTDAPPNALAKLRYWSLSKSSPFLYVSSAWGEVALSNPRHSNYKKSHIDKKATFGFFTLAIVMIKIPRVRRCSPVGRSWTQALKAINSCTCRQIIKSRVWTEVPLLLLNLRLLYLDPDFLLLWALEVSIDLSQS